MALIEVRFHGRGGQGAKITSRILGRSGFLCGLEVQDFALFGAERRGAPVVSFTRLSSDRIDHRGPIEQPNLIVVMDDSLLKEAGSQVFQGVHEDTPIIVNVEPAAFEVEVSVYPKARYVAFNLTELARRRIGRDFISATAAAVAAKSVPEITLTALEHAVVEEITEFGLSPEMVGKNVAAARDAYERAPAMDLTSRGVTDFASDRPSAPTPYLISPRFAGPTIRQRGSAGLRQTGNWRTERPVIALEKCKRCFLCYLYCPEAAMRLDTDNFPHVDYEHCKGCMICYEECPTDAITRRLEV
jgi:pyruvate ferredoxin oxidoreductase gamma subunit